MQENHRCESCATREMRPPSTKGFARGAMKQKSIVVFERGSMQQFHPARSQILCALDHASMNGAIGRYACRPCRTSSRHGCCKQTIQSAVAYCTHPEALRSIAVNLAISFRNLASSTLILLLCSCCGAADGARPPVRSPCGFLTLWCGCCCAILLCWFDLSCSGTRLLAFHPRPSPFSTTPLPTTAPCSPHFPRPAIVATSMIGIQISRFNISNESEKSEESLQRVGVLSNWYVVDVDPVLIFPLRRQATVQRDVSVVAKELVAVSFLGSPTMSRCPECAAHICHVPRLRQLQRRNAPSLSSTGGYSLRVGQNSLSSLLIYPFAAGTAASNNPQLSGLTGPLNA